MEAFVEFIRHRTAGEIVLILICGAIGMFALGIVAGEGLADIVALLR